jgi:hypothetical protein
MIKAYVVKCKCGAITRVYPPGHKDYRNRAQCNICGSFIDCRKGYWLTKKSSPVEEKELDLLEVE